MGWQMHSGMSLEASFPAFTNCIIQSSIFFPEYDLVELVVHVYLQSMHNISIERQWLRLRMEWGNKVVFDFEKGTDDGHYNPQNEKYQYVTYFLFWSRLMRHHTVNLVHGCGQRFFNEC
jgi:hypothetical protein